MTFDEILTIRLLHQVARDEIDYGVAIFYLWLYGSSIFLFLREMRDRDARATFSSEHYSGGSPYATIPAGDERGFTLKPS